VRSGRRIWLAVAGAAGGAALLAPQLAGWWPEPARASSPAAARERGRAHGDPEALRAREVLRPGETIDPLKVPALPPGPMLASADEPAPAIPVQWIRRCRTGDRLVTVERIREGTTWIVVHRGGVPCFRLPFPDGPERSPAALRVFGTVGTDGTAGPIAIVHAHPMEPRLYGGGSAIRRTALRLLVVDDRGAIRIDRTLEATAASFGSFGSAIEVTPVLWDEARRSLLAWSSARRWDRGAAQCLGSLLDVGRRGPIAVAEGVPCAPTGVADVDGDGAVEILASTAPEEGAPWEAVVTRAGDFVATFSEPGGARLLPAAAGPALIAPPPGPWSGARLLPFPWTGAGLLLPPDEGVRFALDWDGDGRDELVLATVGGATVVDADGGWAARLFGRPLAARRDGTAREILLAAAPCGVVAVDGRGGARCAPGAMEILDRVEVVGAAFDWTADGTPDVTAIGRGADGARWMTVWTEGDLTFAWPAEEGEGADGEAGHWRMEPPRHQVRRALALSGAGGPEVLVSTPAGFAIRAVPGGEVRWEGRVEDGVLDAWALPASGPSALARGW